MRPPLPDRAVREELNLCVPLSKADNAAPSTVPKT